MSRDAVLAELVHKGLAADRAAEALERIESAEPSANLAEIIGAARALGVADDSLCYTPTLARGLDYYTGMIFEVHLGNAGAGSAAGGGRYDNLIGGLGGPDTPAVGVGFGFDRIVEAAEAGGLVPGVDRGADVLVTQLDASTRDEALQLAGALRGQGVAVEVYPQTDKLGKQFKLADAKNIPLALMLGSDELRAGQVTVKDLRSGEQQKVAREAMAETVRRLLDTGPAARRWPSWSRPYRPGWATCRGPRRRCRWRRGRASAGPPATSPRNTGSVPHCCRSTRRATACTWC